MVKFLRFFLRNGKPLLKSGSLQTMETPNSSLAARSGLASGYAIANEDGHYYNKYNWRGHEGIVGTCNSHYLYNRELGLGFVLSCNGNSSIQPIENLVADFLERNNANPKTQAPAALDLKAILPFTGLYQSAAPRYELLALMDGLMLTSIELNGSALYINQMGIKTRLVPTGTLTFKKENANTPSVVFSKNEAGEPVVIIDGVYCERVNAWWAYTKLALILAALLLSLLSIPLPIVALIRAWVRKLDYTKLPLYFLPLLSLAALIWAMVNFSKVQAESYLLYELRGLSARSLAIFAGTLLFGILSVVNMAWMIKAFRSFKSRFSAWYLLLTALSLILVNVILLLNGWIGLRTWAM